MVIFSSDPDPILTMKVHVDVKSGHLLLKVGRNTANILLWDYFIPLLFPFLSKENQP